MEFDILFIDFWKTIINNPIFINDLLNTKDIIDFINYLIEIQLLNGNSTISIEELNMFNDMLFKFISDNPLMIIPDNFKSTYIWISQFTFYSSEFWRIWNKNQSN